MAAEHGAFLKESDELRDLRVLEEIERNPSVSQRELARGLGVALGIANACVHTLVRKGLVKIRGENNRSITYHLTKAGRLQKARLAMEWTANTIDFYRQTRTRVVDQLRALAQTGASRIVLYGADEVAELVVMTAPAAGVAVEGIVAPEGRRIGDDLLGVHVADLGALASLEFDAVLTCVRPSEAGLADLVRALRGDHASVPVVTLSGERLDARPVRKRS